jgi:hypothetical protein
MPEALRQALERLQQHRAQNAAGGEAQQSPQPAPKSARLVSNMDPSALTAGWCDTGYYDSGYGDCPGGQDFQVCLDNWWNGAYASHPDATYAYTNVCPATGAVVLAVQSDHGGSGIWTVPQNTVRWWTIHDWDCGTLFDWDCPSVRADVKQASGDRFHFRFAVWE